ncbi:MAG: hypothetical protein JWO38_2503 [Gemmataceae bacterium]|nr:hypothetical protein [Gemmataceae bacterium]
MRSALALSVFAVGLLLAHAPANDPDGFTPLFNGKDLAGWKAFGRATKDGPTTPIEPGQSWTVADGVLRCTGKPTGYLVTDKEYGDYVLKLKWRYPKDLKAGNSGVLLHCQKDDKVWPVCLEAQLRSGRAGDLWLQTAADVKLTVDPTRRDADDKTKRHIWRAPKDGEVEKPFGEWNEYEITCKGGDIAVAVNGKKVNEGSECSLTKGRIGIQAEGTEIHFKDIAIKTAK